jgi:heme A synthase
MDLQTLLIRTISIIGLVWYYLCLLHLGLKPTPKDQTPNGFRQFQALSITTISVSLATYVGFVIGIKGTSHLPASPSGEPGNSGSNAASQTSSGLLDQIANSHGFDDLRVLSAAIYIFSLVMALWFYYRKQDETEPAITGLAKSLLGFVAGVLSITLGLQSAP